MDDFNMLLEKNKKLVYSQPYDEYHFTPSLIKGRETENTNATQMLIKKKDIEDKDYLQRELYMDNDDIEKFFDCTMNHRKIEELLKMKADQVIMSRKLKYNFI